MKKILIAMLLCMGIFAACGTDNNGNGNVQEEPTVTVQDDATEEERVIVNEVAIVTPSPWEIPAEAGNIDVAVDGRTVTFSLESADAEDLVILVLDGGDILHVEQTRYASPFSYTFTLGDDVAPGTYALVIGGLQPAIRTNITIN